MADLWCYLKPIRNTKVQLNFQIIVTDNLSANQIEIVKSQKNW